MPTSLGPAVAKGGCWLYLISGGVAKGASPRQSGPAV